VPTTTTATLARALPVPASTIRPDTVRVIDDEVTAGPKAVAQRMQSVTVDKILRRGMNVRSVNELLVALTPERGRCARVLVATYDPFCVLY
jgi:hypothetical protein